MTSIDEIKRAAAGHELEMLTSVAGIPTDVLDGKGHPCPRCGGNDRFSLVDRDDGAVLCRKCFAQGNGDWLAATMWHRGMTLPEAIAAAAEHLGVGSKKKHELRREVARYEYRDERNELEFQVVR